MEEWYNCFRVLHDKKLVFIAKKCTIVTYCSFGMYC